MVKSTKEEMGRLWDALSTETEESEASFWRLFVELPARAENRADPSYLERAIHAHAVASLEGFFRVVRSGKGPRTENDSDAKRTERDIGAVSSGRHQGLLRQLIESTRGSLAESLGNRIRFNDDNLMDVLGLNDSGFVRRLSDEEKRAYIEARSEILMEVSGKGGDCARLIRDAQAGVTRDLLAFRKAVFM
jgi:hypothetical protein